MPPPIRCLLPQTSLFDLDQRAFAFGGGPTKRKPSRSRPGVCNDREPEVEADNVRRRHKQATRVARAQGSGRGGEGPLEYGLRSSLALRECRSAPKGAATNSAKE